MAKKRPKQKRIPGTFDEPNPVVQAKAEAYADTLRKRMALQVQESNLRLELIDAMKKQDVETCELDDEIVTLEHIEKDRIKVKAKPDIDEFE